MGSPFRKYPPEIVRQKMIAWCNKAERCQWDVRRKLLDWHIPSTERELLISELISLDLLNESRYASAFAHDKASFNQWGAKKIEMQLKAKGISERNIRDAIKTIDQGEAIEQIKKLITKKAAQLKGLLPSQKKNKIVRYLLGKGYDLEMILKEFDH
jgi:regulatory protein